MVVIKWKVVLKLMCYFYLYIMKNWGLYYMKVIYDMDLFIFIFC